VEDGIVERTAFENVPSFVYLVTSASKCLAWATLPLTSRSEVRSTRSSTPLTSTYRLTAPRMPRYVDIGRDLKKAVLHNFDITHPVEPDLSTLFGVILTGPARDPAHHSGNVTVSEADMVDRSATGTGISARAALDVAHEDLAIGETVTIESILDSTLTVTPLRTTPCVEYPAIVPEVGGRRTSPA
jgi:proline racemase